MKPSVRRRWERANATLDCWDDGYRMHPERIRCALALALWADEVSDGRGLLHKIAASMVLDGIDYRRLP